VANERNNSTILARSKNMSTTAEREPSDLMENLGEQCEEQAEDFAELMAEMGDSLQKYCARRPGVVAGVLFGLGFFCGWKLRPW
jgi:hypothetical protein